MSTVTDNWRKLHISTAKISMSFTRTFATHVMCNLPRQTLKQTSHTYTWTTWWWWFVFHWHNTLLEGLRFDDARAQKKKPLSRSTHANRRMLADFECQTQLPLCYLIYSTRNTVQQLLPCCFTCSLASQPTSQLSNAISCFTILLPVVCALKSRGLGRWEWQRIISLRSWSHQVGVLETSVQKTGAYVSVVSKTYRLVAAECWTTVSLSHWWRL